MAAHFYNAKPSKIFGYKNRRVVQRPIEKIAINSLFFTVGFSVSLLLLDFSKQRSAVLLIFDDSVYNKVCY